MDSCCQLNADFILAQTEMSWRDVVWGYERKVLGWKDLVKVAFSRLETGSENAIEIELAGLGKSEAHLAGDFARRLAEAEGFKDESIIKRK